MLLCQRLKHRLLLLVLQRLFHRYQLRFIIHLSRDNVELRARRFLFRIDSIARAGSRNSATLVEQFRENKLTGNLFAIIIRAKNRIRCRRLRRRIAGLNHKILYHPMEQHTIVCAGLYIFHKIITMSGSQFR